MRLAVSNDETIFLPVIFLFTKETDKNMTGRNVKKIIDNVLSVLASDCVGRGIIIRTAAGPQPSRTSLAHGPDGSGEPSYNLRKTIMSPMRDTRVR